jgi:UDP-N-acetylmuramoyl-tripeptide--D-alanyl-D-alanine ligase
MGANHQGEIAELCKIADPDFGIITNIGKAHLKGFGSFEGVKKAKGELYDYIFQKKGTIFYNNDNPVLRELTEKIDNKISFGKENADFTGEPIDSPPFVHIKANFTKGILYLNTNLTGSYNVENVLAAACIGNFFSVDPIKIQKAVKEYKPENNRSQLIRKGEIKIIMDAYNANPTSMKASITSFLQSFSNQKTYLILGDMLELGDYSQEEHIGILREIHNFQPDDVFLTGPEFMKAAKGFRFNTFENITQLCDFLKNNPLAEGAVLIKGSRGIQLEKVLDVL